MWSLQPGARLDITTPASLLAVDWSRQNYCLLAGGIGITPIFGAAQALARLCGPMRMLDAARHAWVGAGHPLPDLRYETFGSSGTLPTETFRVRLKGSDVELEIPRERSMLDVRNASGHDVMYDCKRGECGLCAIDVVAIDGEIDHRDVFFFVFLLFCF